MTEERLAMFERLAAEITADPWRGIDHAVQARSLFAEAVREIRRLHGPVQVAERLPGMER